MSEMCELVQVVPAELARGCKGLALDIGGSLIKFVYRDNSDKESFTGSEKRFGRLHLVSFPRGELEAAFDYVRQRADVTRGARDNTDEPPLIHTTGTGCTELFKQISSALNIRMQSHVVREQDYYVSSFVYLSARLPRCDFLEPFDAEATGESLVQIQMTRLAYGAMASRAAAGQSKARSVGAGYFDVAIKRVQERISTVYLDDGLPLVEAEPDMFPCLLVVCGSTVVYNQVNADGSFQLVDGGQPCGKAFMGIGNLMLGEQKFSELIELAKKGNARNVDQYSDYLKSPNDFARKKDDTYSIFGANSSFLLYAFGKAVGVDKESLKREDVARAWLNFAVADVVRGTLQVCRINGLRRVFFCGGFSNNPFVRHVMTSEFVFRMIAQMIISELDLYRDFDFVRPGTFLGALGCALADININKSDQN